MGKMKEIATMDFEDFLTFILECEDLKEDPAKIRAFAAVKLRHLRTTPRKQHGK